MEKIGFGGGCHWCTEAVFQALRGVHAVRQGWIKSPPPFDTFSEAVLVDFEPREIDLATLIEVHLRTHASQSEHSFRTKYRSAVYVFDERQSEFANRALRELQQAFDAPLITKVMPFDGFRASEPRIQNYYLQNPERPFCKNYIDPKLALLRRKFKRFAKTNDDEAGERASEAESVTP
ncbi:MAG: peptide-methionine (S)-S-oxide reductase [Pseudomonadota bacterium]